MFGYIYETTNEINGKKYIGQSKLPFKGWYYGSSKIIINALKKYGKENFSIKILKIAKNKKQLNELEIKIIKERDATNSKQYYNLHEGGRGGDTFSGKTHSKEVREKMRKAKKGKPSGRKGAYGKWDPETNKKRSDSMKKWREKNKEFYSDFLETFRKKCAKYYGVEIDGIKYSSLTEASQTLNITKYKLRFQDNIKFIGSIWKGKE